MSSYRPSYGSQRDNRDHRGGGGGSSRRSPPRRSPPTGMYQFGGDTYRPGSYNDRDAPRNGDRRDDFTFRSGDHDLRFPPTDAQHAARNRNNKRPQARDGQRRSRQHNQPGRTGPWRPPAPHERPILRSTREKTPEQLNGMSDGTAKFISLSDISDSEAEMELESGAEDTSGDEAHPSAKKPRVQEEDQADANAAPRWSNPDPYTSLPPPDETQGKRRDFVKLIRKAKVTAEQEKAASNAVAQNADFISLTFDDDDGQQGSDADSDASGESESRRGGNAPAHQVNGSSFSHLDNLHPDRTTPSLGDPSGKGKSNDVVPLTAASLGPPPGLPGLPPPPSMNGLDVWPPPPPPPRAPQGQKRAREDDDDLESLPPPPPRGKKRKREIIDGRIVEDWLPRSGISPTPWCTVDHSLTEHMGFWLHKEISDFYDFVRPHPFEDAIRNDLVKRISDCLAKAFPGSSLHCFGSFAAGLYLPTADMDLVLLSRDFRNRGYPQFGAKKTLFKVSSILERAGITQPGTTEVVASARVPIIKLVDRVTGLKVDISFENNTGIIANRTFQDWKSQYPAMPVIATLIKQFLAMRGLNEVFTGGLGGFSVICMVVSLIHQMPAHQSGNFNPEHNLGEVLLNFLDLYGNKFNINTTRISLRPHRYEVKGAMDLNGKPTKPDRLSIIDPNTPTNDISSGSHNIVLIQKCFRDAFAALQRRMAQLKAMDIPARRNASILEDVFGGDYSSFHWQRNRLRKIYEKQR